MPIFQIFGFNLYNYPKIKYFIKFQFGKIIHNFPKDIKNAGEKTSPINSVGSIEKLCVYIQNGMQKNYVYVNIFSPPQ